jgi:hypothetical protein
MEGPHEIILETGEKIYVTRLVRFFKRQTEVVVMIPCVCVTDISGGVDQIKRFQVCSLLSRVLRYTADDFDGWERKKKIKRFCF